MLKYLMREGLSFLILMKMFSVAVVFAGCRVINYAVVAVFLLLFLCSPKGEA